MKTANVIKVAAIQLNSGAERTANLAVADRLVRHAAAAGARLVALPETFDLIGPPPAALDPAAWKREQASPPGGETERWAAAIARELGILLCAGSMLYRRQAGGPVTNTATAWGPDGARLAEYDKIHLADLRRDGAALREDGIAAGDRLAWCPLGEPGGWRAGLGICYDLRFPELFRALAAPDDVMAILLPSAFYFAFGAAHWEVLLRARAIENQVYVIAPNQTGIGGDGRRHYGHSRIIDPYGAVMAAAGEEAEAVLLADLDSAVVTRCRDEIPARRHVRGRVEFPDLRRR